MYKDIIDTYMYRYECFLYKDIMQLTVFYEITGEILLHTFLDPLGFLTPAHCKAPNLRI